jgi:glycosyltransferase involved in cell wall biosynthesis
MKERRIVLVSRRFWPLTGGPETAMAQLAAGFQRRGANVTLLTLAWDPNWPTTVDFNGIRLIRLPQPQRGWLPFRQVQSIQQWLRQNRDQIDLVFVSGLRYDAWSALRAFSHADRTVPIVLRAENAGQRGECHWLRNTRRGSHVRRLCQTADAMIAPDGDVVQELLANGFSPARIYRIPHGVTPPAITAATGCNSSRQALSDGNADLTTFPDTPVAVGIGRLHPSNDWSQLLRAWRQVVRELPTVRLWLFGDGPDRDRLWQQIRDDDLRPSVALPGNLDDVGDALLAADLFIATTADAGLSQSLLEAAAAGLPLIAANTRENRELQRIVGPMLHLFSPGDTADLANVVLERLQNPTPDKTLREGQRAVLREHSMTRMIDAHCELFERLIREKSVRSKESIARGTNDQLRRSKMDG